MEKRYVVYCEIIFRLPLHERAARAIKKDYKDPPVLRAQKFFDDSRQLPCKKIIYDTNNNQENNYPYDTGNSKLLTRCYYMIYRGFLFFWCFKHFPA